MKSHKFMSKINWKIFAIVAIPGMVFFMIAHNYFFYQEKPLETIGDIIWAILN